MTKFSPQLIEEITQYHQDRYGITLTPGQAEEYLNSWADLWSAVARGSQGAPPSVGGARLTAPILDI